VGETTYSFPASSANLGRRPSAPTEVCLGILQTLLLWTCLAPPTVTRPSPFTMFALHFPLDIQRQMVELVYVWRSIFGPAGRHPLVYYKWM